MDKQLAHHNEEFLHHLRETSDQLITEVENLLDDEANFSPVEGEWSVKEVLCHLRDADQINLKRLNTILEEDEPFLRAFNPDELDQEHDYKSENWKDVRDTFKEARSGNLDLLAKLEPIQWLKGAIHQERGHVTIRDLAESLQSHSETHLEQIRHVRWLAK